MLYRLLHSLILHHYLKLFLFLTELCCAEKLVKDLKKEIESVFSFKVPSAQFLKDYESLQKEYTDQGNLAVYLYDTNLLANIYRKYRNDEFAARVDQGFRKITEDDEVEFRAKNIGGGMVLHVPRCRTNKEKTGNCSEVPSSELSSSKPE